jgi:hypothetical protein
MGGAVVPPAPLIPFIQLLIVPYMVLLSVIWADLVRCAKRCLLSPREPFRIAISDTWSKMINAIVLPIGMSVYLWCAFFVQIYWGFKLASLLFLWLTRKMTERALGPRVASLLRESIQRYARYRQFSRVAYPLMWQDHTYQYYPLTRMRVIRLLVLYPGLFEEPLSGDIVEADMERRPIYDALTWSSELKIQV